MPSNVNIHYTVKCHTFIISIIILQVKQIALFLLYEYFQRAKMAHSANYGTNHRLITSKSYEAKMLAGQISDRSDVNKKSRVLKNLSTFQRMLELTVKVP